MNRRELLIGALSTAALAGAPAHGVVLLHGAWHGGWCWDELRRVWSRTNVVAPTLTGLAERARELDASVNLDTHVRDVVAASAPFARVTLVGHSYAGLVLSHAVNVLHEKIERLIYLDAFLPADGQSGFDLLKPEYVKHWKERAKGGLAVPPMLSAKSMGVLDVEQAKKVDARLTPHPVATFEQKVSFDDAKWKALPKQYIRCAKYSGFAPTAARAKTLGLEVSELDSGHDAMIGSPRELAAALEEAISR